MSRLEDLQLAAATALLEVVPPNGWAEVSVRYAKAGPRAESIGYYIGTDGNEHSIQVPTSTVLALGELKKEMATPEHGAWLSAMLRLTPDRKVKFSYNYDERPDWDVEPTDEAYIEDLAMYPRKPSETPIWYPRRNS